MKYIGFEIDNYKGIKKLSLDFSSNPNLKTATLVGLNESGKTTILEAINLIQRDVDKSDCYLLIPRSAQYRFSGDITVTARLELEKGDYEQIKTFARKNCAFELSSEIKRITLKKIYSFDSARFSGPTKTEYDVLLVGKGTRKAAKDKKIDPREQKYQKIVDFIESDIRPPIIYYPNFLSDFPEKIYLNSQPGGSAKNRAYRRVIQDILDSLDTDGKSFSLESDILERMKSDEPQDKAALNSLLLKIGNKIAEDIFGAWKKILNPREKKGLDDKKIIVSCGTDEELDSNGESVCRYHLSIKVEKGPESYAISEQSLGFRWFFSYFLFTEFRKNRAIDKGEILFLIDEPASNLHSTAQKKLLETFQELTKKSKLIYTTHSHHLINPEWLEGAYIVQNKALNYDSELTYDRSRTDIDALSYRKFVATHPDQQTYFQPILDKLDYKPSSLEMVPEMVVVEGKNDFYTLKYIDEVFFNGQYKNLHLCPGNGAGKNDKLIQLYMSWGRNFLILCDSDSAGRKAKESYQDNYGILVQERIFTLEDTDSSFKSITTEGLFSSDAERLRIIQAIFSSQKTFSKKMFNQAIQNLLFLKQEVKLNNPTLESFKNVFELLSKKMTNGATNAPNDAKA